MTTAAVLTTGLLTGSGSLSTETGTMPTETTVSGITVKAQTAGEDTETEGEKAANGENTDSKYERAGPPGLGITLDILPPAVVIFSANTGAYTSGTVRAATGAAPAGQLEARYYVGLFHIRTMMRVILPQALRIAFPPLSNSLIGLMKDTSLVADITVVEMFMSAQRVAAGTYEPFILYREAGIIYLIFCTTLTRPRSVWEQKLGLRWR